MVTIALNKPGSFSHKIEFPSTWDELTTEELETIGLALYSETENLAEDKVFIFCFLIESRAKAQKVKLPTDWKINLNYEHAAAQGFDAIEFLFTKNNRTINPYPTLKVNRKILIGPANDFDHITCGELEDAEAYYFEFHNKKSWDFIAKIAAVLWRPANTDYSEKNALQWEKQLSKLPSQKLIAILIWYAGCQGNLKLYFPTVYESDESGQPDPAAFTKCIHAGAGPKNGTRDNIRKMRAKEFLFDMELEAQQIKKMQAQNK